MKKERNKERKVPVIRTSFADNTLSLPLDLYHFPSIL
jgi:hypothetical protein